MINDAQIKERLNAEIAQSGLTHTEIARRVGISITMLSQYKYTKKMPSIETFARICEIIDSSADYILGIHKG